MKREGRQHGVVRSYPILPTPFSRQRRYVKTVDSSSVAGLFTKVSSKPTNHSKFTGKCGTPRCLGCHAHPVYKSKVKAKGSNKSRSVGSDSGLLIGCPAGGTSVVDALAYLGSGDYRRSYDDDSAIDDYDYDYYGDDDDTADCKDEYGIIGAGDNSIVRDEYFIGVEGEDEWVNCDGIGLCWGKKKKKEEDTMKMMDGIWPD